MSGLPKKLQAAVDNASVEKRDRDDDLRVYTVDLADELGETFDVEARTPAEARKKLLAFLAERDTEEPGA